MKMPDDFLIIYAKAPVAGIAKTRLFPHISFEEAAMLHEAMVADMVDMCASLPMLRLWLSYTPAGTVGLFKSLLGDVLGDRTLEYLPQDGDGLGERMHRSFCSAFNEGAKRTVIVGTDVPSLQPYFIRGAFHRLSMADLVIGPAKDGGYYLIGLNRPVPEIFMGVEWSGADVLATTLDVSKRLGLKAELLPTLMDIDTFEDLKDASSGPMPPRTGKMVAALMHRFTESEWLV